MDLIGGLSTAKRVVDNDEGNADDSSLPFPVHQEAACQSDDRSSTGEDPRSRFGFRSSFSEYNKAAHRQRRTFAGGRLGFIMGCAGNIWRSDHS
jgi:hypothetical protein